MDETTQADATNSTGEIKPTEAVASPVPTVETPTLSPETIEPAATPSAQIGSSGHADPSQTVPTVTGGQPEDAPAPIVTQPVIKGNNKKLRAILIIGIAIILAALAFYFYSKKGTISTSKAPTTSKVTQTALATSQDVADTINSVDSTVKNTDSSKDISSTDLNNSSLGL